MKPQYWVGEVTDDHARVYHDWTRAMTAQNAAKYFQREYGGVCYWIEGPLPTEAEANKYLAEVIQTAEVQA